MSLGHPVSDCWLSRQCRAWTPSGGMDLKLKQSLVSHFHQFCLTIAAAHLAGRTDGRLKVSWLGWWPCLSFHSLWKIWRFLYFFQIQNQLGFITLCVGHWGRVTSDPQLEISTVGVVGHSVMLSFYVSSCCKHLMFILWSHILTYALSAAPKPAVLHNLGLPWKMATFFLSCAQQ